jgi:anti-sigma regulatory factor (Ser/Thr protein kinase)
VARAFICETLAAADHDAQYVALLLGSELVTNAILHARTPVRLGIVLDGDLALVCVGDRMIGAELTPQRHVHDRRGSGLALVAELSDHWGSAAHAGGKTVWFTIPVLVGSRQPGCGSHGAVPSSGAATAHGGVA